jgi:hypothetical protein
MEGLGGAEKVTHGRSARTLCFGTSSDVHQEVRFTLHAAAHNVVDSYFIYWIFCVLWVLLTIAQLGTNKNLIAVFKQLCIKV